MVYIMQIYISLLLTMQNFKISNDFLWKGLLARSCKKNYESGFLDLTEPFKCNWSQTRTVNSLCLSKCFIYVLGKYCWLYLIKWVVFSFHSIYQVGIWFSIHPKIIKLALFHVFCHLFYYCLNSLVTTYCI